MRFLPLVFIAGLNAACLAQQATPPPRNDPFQGFGHTSLDQRPEGRTTRPPAGAPGSAAPTPSYGGSSLDRRPPGARFVTPPPSVSSMIPLAPSHGLNFEAKTLASGGAATVSRSAATGLVPSVTTTETRNSHPALQVKVTNVGQQPEIVHFDWYFVARTAAGNQIFVWDQGERDVAMVARGEGSELLESRDLTSENTKTTRFETKIVRINPTDPNKSSYTESIVVPIGSQERIGARPYGWIVRMFVEGKLAKVQASSNPLELIGRDPGELEKLVPRRPASPLQGTRAEIGQ